MPTDAAPAKGKMRALSGRTMAAVSALATRRVGDIAGGTAPTCSRSRRGRSTRSGGRKR